MYNIGNRHRPSPLFFYVFGPAIAMNSQTGYKCTKSDRNSGRIRRFYFTSPRTSSSCGTASPR